MYENVRVFIMGSTHWDGEWYEPFRGFRCRLVDGIEELMDRLDRYPERQTFTFDGQTIVLEDCLEIASENCERLQRYIRDGRIVIGP